MRLLFTEIDNSLLVEKALIIFTLIGGVLIFCQLTILIYQFLIKIGSKNEKINIRRDNRLLKTLLN